MTSTPTRTTTNRAIAYIRVSTSEQATSGLGLAAQLAAIQDFARRQSLTIDATHADEGISGAAPLDQRAGLLAAVQDLDRGSVLLVSRLDRLSRGDAIELAVLEQLVSRHGARILSTTGEGTDRASDDPTGQLTRTLIGAIARYERSLISARTRAALQAKRARGERCGTERFGRDEREQAILAIVEDARSAGYSLPAIAAELNAKGYTTRSGQPWRYEYVRGVLKTIAGTRRAPNKTARATRAALAIVGRQK